MIFINHQGIGVDATQHFFQIAGDAKVKYVSTLTLTKALKWPAAPLGSRLVKRLG
ncbi:hypothetical protein [Rhodoferax sp. PAMC 29310]|uniref:hypothetical protein n=1 Tax=Rhodoferax sp. PAMC 29310 TaxID=2822760 RepID=UPI001B326F3D|nr:hypothetical protein [Rhodoferax sp. PAMC 29310]